MALGVGRTMPSGERPQDVWILGTRLVSGSYTRPVVFHKPAGSPDFSVKYIGADIPLGDSLTFLRGVRNRRDAAGAISVHSFYQFSSGRLQNPDWQNMTFGQSADNGATWTYPGINSSTTAVENEQSTAATGTPVTYTSNDVQMAGGICSPTPGVVYALGKERVGFQQNDPPTPRKYYEYNLCLLRSTAGSALSSIATIAPLTRFNTAYHPVNDGPPFFDKDGTYTDPATSNNPRAIYSGQVPTAPSRMVSVEIQTLRGQTDGSGYLAEYSYATVGTDGTSQISGLPCGTPATWGSAPAVAWDGRHFYYGSSNSSGVRKMVRASDPSGPWSDVFTGGTPPFTGIAARRPGQLYVSGKGYTTDGGATWTTVTRTLTRVGFFGTRFYGFSGTTAYTSRDGISWDTVTLPTVSGFNGLVDVFGG